MQEGENFMGKFFGEATDMLVRNHVNDLLFILNNTWKGLWDQIWQETLSCGKQ